MKKPFALLLAGMLALSMLTACGGGDSKGSSATGDSSTTTTGADAEEVVLGLVSFNNIPDDYSHVAGAINDYIGKTYPDSNIKLKLQLYGPAEYAQKINLALQSGTPMDIFVPLGLMNYISQNQCLPLEDLLETHGKGIKEILAKDFGEEPFKAVSMNGHIYAVPVNKGMVVVPTLTYNKDMLAAIDVSIDDINSVDDLAPVFEKIKAKYPDIYPFAGTNAQDSSIMQVLTEGDKVDVLSDSTNFMGVVMGDSGKVVNLYETEEFYEKISLMRSWYNSGYLPTDMATSQTRAQELFNADRLFCSIAGYGGNEIGVTMSSQTGRNIGSKRIAPYYFDSAAVGVSMTISSTTKVAESAMKMLNLIYTDEFIINTILYGIEGKDYVKVDEHHWAYPEGLDSNTVGYTASLCTGVIGSESLQYQPEGVSYDDVLLKSEDNKTATRSPYYGFAFDGSKVVNEVTALANVYTQYMPGLICGSLDPDVAIPEYNAALKAAGIENVIAAKQEQLDKWIAENK